MYDFVGQKSGKSLARGFFGSMLHWQGSLAWLDWGWMSDSLMCLHVPISPPYGVSSRWASPRALGFRWHGSLGTAALGGSWLSRVKKQSCWPSPRLGSGLIWRHLHHTLLVTAVTGQPRLKGDGGIIDPTSQWEWHAHTGSKIISYHIVRWALGPYSNAENSVEPCWSPGVSLLRAEAWGSKEK